MGLPLPSELAMIEPARKDVILGMPGPWAENNKELSDHYTTKIGGIADWPMLPEEGDAELLKCGLCRGDLVLVAQVYAPLSVRSIQIDERTIYVFGCPSSTCGINPLSWRTLRVQGSLSASFSEGTSRAVISNTEASTSSTDKFTGEGLAEGDGQSEPEDQSVDCFDCRNWGTVGWRNGPDDDAFLNMDELEAALLESGYSAAAPLTTQTIHGEEDFTVTHVDTRSGQEDHNLSVLPCFYVYFQNESHPLHGNQTVSGLEQTVERTDSHADAEEWQGEEYEHDQALSTDRAYLKFKKRLDRHPEQCLRYCFGGTPLWANKNTIDPGVCLHCGAPRVYEMQLMPPLLYYLQQGCKDLPLTACSPHAWEWLTLIVFTCSQNCTPCLPGESNKPWIIVEESSVLQYET